MKHRQALWDEFVQRVALQYANTNVEPREVASRAAALADALIAERTKRIAQQSRFDMTVDGVEVCIPLDGWTHDQINALAKVWRGYIAGRATMPPPPDTLPEERSSEPTDALFKDDPEAMLEELDNDTNNLIPFQKRDPDA